MKKLLKQYFKEVSADHMNKYYGLEEIIDTLINREECNTTIEPPKDGIWIYVKCSGPQHDVYHWNLHPDVFTCKIFLSYIEGLLPELLKNSEDYKARYKETEVMIESIKSHITTHELNNV